MVLAVLSVLIFFFSCSLSPTPNQNTNNSGSSGGSSVVYDTNSPTVVIVAPMNGQVFYDTNVTVSGTASDEGSGVKEVWLSVNGGGFGLVNGTTSWSTNVTVNYGSNTIRVYAVDNSNNVSTTNTVSFVVGDTNKPAVIIVTPTNGQVFYDTTITVSGTASDVGSGLKEVWLSVNGGSYGKVDGTTNWSTNVVVDYGNNTISVYAVDNLNNVSVTNIVSFVVVVKTIYVSTSGDNGNNGLSPSTSVRSLVRAMEVANTIDSGTNVLVKVGFGVYTPGSGLSSSVRVL
jgi:hypothetical protein